MKKFEDLVQETQLYTDTLFEDSSKALTYFLL